MAGRIPFPFDLTMRPIKYVEAGEGATFAAGANDLDPEGFNARMLRSEALSSSEVSGWTQVSEMGIGSRIWAGGAFGLVGGNPALGIPDTPTYCIGGSQGVEISEGVIGGRGLIFRSTDGGLSWSNVYSEDGVTVYVMGFDTASKTFYAQAYTHINDPGDGQIHFACLASSDGSGWSTIEIHSAPADAENLPIWASSFLTGTGHSEVRDSDGNVVPYGGLFGWKDRGKDTEIIVAPRPRGVYRTFSLADGSDEGLPSNTVDIIKKVINPATGVVSVQRSTSSAPMEHLTCIAGYGDIWQAGGYNGDSEGGIIALSNDDGQSWTTVYSGLSEITCMMAGPPPEPPPAILRRRKP